MTELDQVRPNPYESDTWGENEAGRLKDMDAVLAEVTLEDLTSVLGEISGGMLLDIGAGTGTTVAALSKQHDVGYIALDVNESELRQRGSEEEKVVARSEALPFADGSMDVTYSRAAVAWSQNPQQSILEQLRVTSANGVAIFTDFDWSTAKPGQHSDPEEAALMIGMRDTMLNVLSMVGFKPNYGSQLAGDIDAVTAGDEEKYIREEIVHEFPEGNYRGLLLGAAGELAGQLRKYKMDDIAEGLESDMQRFEALSETPSFTIPRLLTQRVFVRT